MADGKVSKLPPKIPNVTSETHRKGCDFSYFFLLLLLLLLLNAPVRKKSLPILDTHWLKVHLAMASDAVVLNLHADALAMICNGKYQCRSCAAPHGHINCPTDIVPGH